MRTIEGEEGSPTSIRIDGIPAVSAAMSGRRAVFTSLEPRCTMDCVLPSTDAQPGRAAPPPRSSPSSRPLVASEQIIGLLVVSGGDLGPEDEQVFTAFAHQAAAAWRKTRLMQDLEGSLAQLRQTQEQLLHAQKMEAIGRWRAASRTTSTTSSR